MTDESSESAAGDLDGDAAEGPSATRRIKRWERLLDRASEWLNPILVKESRQAMKSHQFLTTFSLLLICCWLWSLLGVALRSPGIYYVPGGRFMLIGYFLIQNLPLTIIIPFAAFRSLACEREDGTFELLSISTLKPRQIVGGKLGSASLQMMIYLSVLAPCMAFTYLLRGVDILLVLSIVFYSALLSWMLCCVGLLLATLTKARHWQVVISVFFILLLGVICLYSSVGTSVLIAESIPIPFAETEYWVAQAAVITAVLAAGAMSFLAATARITNRSENRSTPLRVGALVCHLLLLGWCSRYWFRFDEEAPLVVYVVLATFGWFVAGTMMTGEDSLLSPRLRRGLPQTPFGRAFLTLLFPGPGTGYLFAVANMLVVYLTTVVLAVQRSGGQWQRTTERAVDLAWIGAAYVTFYLGVNRMFLRRLTRHLLVGPVLGLLLGCILVLLGSAIPVIVQFSLSHYLVNGTDYSLMQLPNVFWTFASVIGGEIPRGFLGVSWLHPLCTVVSPAAAGVFLLNLLRLSTSLEPLRARVPERVLQDNRELRPPTEGLPAPSSPWDDEP